MTCVKCPLAHQQMKTRIDLCQYANPNLPIIMTTTRGLLLIELIWQWLANRQNAASAFLVIFCKALTTICYSHIHEHSYVPGCISKYNKLEIWNCTMMVGYSIVRYNTLSSPLGSPPPPHLLHLILSSCVRTNLYAYNYILTCSIERTQFHFETVRNNCKLNDVLQALKYYSNVFCDHFLFKDLFAVSSWRQILLITSYCVGTEFVFMMVFGLFQWCEELGRRSSLW